MSAKTIAHATPDRRTQRTQQAILDALLDQIVFDETGRKQRLILQRTGLWEH